MANTWTMWSLMAVIMVSLVMIASTNTSAANVDTTRETVSSKQHIRSNTNTNSNRNTNARKPSPDGGIYFDEDLPIDDEGEGSGSNFDDTETSSGKGDDDEDSPLIPGAKEGSGSHPMVTTGGSSSTSNPNTDDEDEGDTDDDDFGSGDDDFESFISSTERPTIRPDVTRAPIVPTHEHKPLDPIDEPFDNSVPKEPFPPKVLTPSETSTRYPLPASTQWPHPPRGGPADTEDDGNQLGNDVSIMGQKQVTPASFFARPGILAAVIGGAVVGLLCAILLVMFIVYRMRKKDEGSYALDEPKRQTSVNPYARGSSKEFFA